MELLELNESEVGQWREIEDYPFVKVLTTRKISYYTDDPTILPVASDTLGFVFE